MAAPSPSSTGLGGYEFLDHTSEITLRVRASTYGGLIRESTEAFAALVPDSIERAPVEGVRDFRMDARDRAAGLVRWLNELAYLSEAESWIPADVTVSEEGSAVHVRARGAALSTPFVLVKAATLHGARVEEGPGGWLGEVTLDI